MRSRFLIHHIISKQINGGLRFSHKGQNVSAWLCKGNPWKYSKLPQTVNRMGLFISLSHIWKRLDLRDDFTKCLILPIVIRSHARRLSIGSFCIHMYMLCYIVYKDNLKPGPCKLVKFFC